MSHHRIVVPRLLALARQFPAIAILGARQIGKSTLARLAFPDHEYIDLERPVDFDRLQADPLLVLTEHARLVVDEAQRLPALFPILRSFLDEHVRHRIVLLGSAAPPLVKGISESLAGRIGFFDLAGISILEHPAPALWLDGAFPRVHWSRPRSRAAEWYPAYLRTCLEQDIPQLGFAVPSLRLRNLMMMLAHSQGGICNLSGLGASLGVNYHAVAHMLDILEGVFLVRRLQPFSRNIRKRLVKAPKVYVRDTGLLHSLLGMTFTRHALLTHPRAGASFETFCLEQIILHARLRDPGAEAFYYRTHTGVEVDLVLSLRGHLIPIEIKLGLGVPDVRPLAIGMSDIGATRGFVVNAGTGMRKIRPGIELCGLRELLAELNILPT